VIKVFENFDFSRVGQMQSLLESHGIRTFMKNEYGSSVVGELPFVEVVPQLFVLEEKDVARAKELLLLDLPMPEQSENWVCPNRITAEPVAPRTGGTGRLAEFP
jgi:hypothetical protein